MSFNPVAGGLWMTGKPSPPEPAETAPASARNAPLNPFEMAETIKPMHLLFTVLISLLTGVLFGLIPAFDASRADLSSTLKESSSRSGTGFRQNKARSLLVISETATRDRVLVMCDGVTGGSPAEYQIHR